MTVLQRRAGSGVRSGATVRADDARPGQQFQAKRGPERSDTPCEDFPVYQVRGPLMFNRGSTVPGVARRACGQNGENGLVYSTLCLQCFRPFRPSRYTEVFRGTGHQPEWRDFHPLILPLTRPYGPYSFSSELGSLRGRPFGVSHEHEGRYGVQVHDANSGTPSPR